MTEDKLLTPAQAVQRLMAIHRQKAPLRARLTLIGALRAGVLEWHCERWSEAYVAENGATFTETGGWSEDEPKFGYPSGFWTDALAVDDVVWRNNLFVSNGTESAETARRDVALWIGRNGGGLAMWTRAADEVRIPADQVLKYLSGPGWTAFANRHPEPSPNRPMAGHYRSALIELIGVAARDPEYLRANLFECVSEAFAVYDAIPDAAEIKRLAKAIRQTLDGPGEAP